jgi:hypothetical protein
MLFLGAPSALDVGIKLDLEVDIEDEGRFEKTIASGEYCVGKASRQDIYL